MDHLFEYITTLEYRLKAAANEIAAFKSGEKYIQMEKYYLGIIRRLERRIKELESEVAKAHAETVSVRNLWFDVVNDMEKECQRKIKKAESSVKAMEKRALKAEKERDDALDKVTQQRHEIYRLGTELEEEKGKIQKLTAQLNHNYENSSIPSSMAIRKKKITNSREKPAKSREPSQDIKDMGEKNISLQKQSSCQPHRKY